eukprot:TRINITY_DN5390_c0_g1_i1.p2 TRINITY_DN5390_c0_g1~~TRINITY_DN5390_c0_g1_i1.p2  ORF type:complete len:64 (-),score=11.69 TRINITY_DN5390_c0_g1_i1:251-442(-)
MCPYNNKSVIGDRPLNRLVFPGAHLAGSNRINKYNRTEDMDYKINSWTKNIPLKNLVISTLMG